MTKLQEVEQMTKGNNRQNNTSAFTVLATFFLGSFIGIASGILLAPRRGQDTIINIKQKTQDALDKGSDKMGSMIDKAKDKVEQTSEKTSRVAQAAKQAVSDVKEPQPKMNPK